MKAVVRVTSVAVGDGDVGCTSMSGHRAAAVGIGRVTASRQTSSIRVTSPTGSNRCKAVAAFNSSAQPSSRTSESLPALTGLEEQFLLWQAKHRQTRAQTWRARDSLPVPPAH